MSERAANGGGTVTDLGSMAKFMSGMKAGFSAMTQAWFGPLEPLPAVVQDPEKEGVAGRAFDYPTGYNLTITPRHGEAVSFRQLRTLADSYDLLRIVIETVKDQIETQQWIIKPVDPKAKPDSRCKAITDFLRRPDGINEHATWLRMLLEDMLVMDAATIYPRRTKGGTLYALEIVDGATIKPILDATGRTPFPPEAAYQQVLKGLPAVNYTRDELLYFPRNRRSNRVYGFGQVEQIIMTVNIALRRQLHQLEFYSEGNTPDLIFGVPSTWQPNQIKQMQLWWDTLINTTASRRKAKFIPGDVKPYDTKEKALKDEFDEWLARVVCFCFSISPQPFIKDMNRATAETSQEASKEDGKGPRMLWVKRLHDFIIRQYFGYTDIEFGWQDQTASDPLVQAQIDQIYLASNVIGPEEVRARIGMEGPLPGKQAAAVMTDDTGEE